MCGLGVEFFSYWISRNNFKAEGEWRRGSFLILKECRGLAFAHLLCPKNVLGNAFFLEEWDIFTCSLWSVFSFEVRRERYGGVFFSSFFSRWPKKTKTLRRKKGAEFVGRGGGGVSWEGLVSELKHLNITPPIKFLVYPSCHKNFSWLYFY